MGLLRLLLAVATLVWHAPPGVVHRFLHPALAVQCFYAISGFLIQLAIHRYKNADHKYWYFDFYKSRCMRLFPLYWLFTALTAICFGTGVFAGLRANHDWQGCLIYLANNMLIVGQDVLRFFTYDTHTHQFSLWPPYTSNVLTLLVNNNTMFGNGYTILGQSWTLAVELWFYLVAPFVLFQSTLVVIGFVAAGMVSRLLFGFYGYSQHTFLYGIITSEIAIFLCGSLAARFYQYLSRKQGNAWRVGTTVLGGGLLVELINQMFGGWKRHPLLEGGGWDQGLLMVPYSYWSVLALTIVSLPFVFYAFGKQKWDRFLGDLSYPLYINHVFIISALEALSVKQENISLYALLLGIVTAILLTYLVERPLDNLRHRYFRKRSDG